MKGFYKIIYVFVLILFLGINSFGQRTKQLFKSDSVLKITIKLSLKELLNSADTREYLKAKVSYARDDGSVFKNKAKVKIRGNNRAMVTTCQFPPLRVNFKKDNTENSVFEGQNKIKLVTHCNKNKRAEQLILKEYLAYKLYQNITPYSFKVRLCEITYIDVSNNDQESTHYGFFIEDLDDLAIRNNMVEFNDSIPNQEVCKREELDKLTVFQFMIGNLDWSIPNRHNIKLISNAQLSHPIAIPYDFDFAGFVGAPYAKPPEEFGIPSVKTRFFMGLCRVEGGYNPTLDFFRAKQSDFISIVSSSDYLTEKNRQASIKYLEGFFEILDKPNQVENKIINGCRAEHKHIYQYDN